jgi:hypothetical protein
MSGWGLLSTSVNSSTKLFLWNWLGMCTLQFGMLSGNVSTIVEHVGQGIERFFHTKCGLLISPLTSWAFKCVAALTNITKIFRLLENSLRILGRPDTGFCCIRVLDIVVWD